MVEGSGLGPSSSHPIRLGAHRSPLHFAGGTDSVQMSLMQVMPLAALQQSLVIVHLS